MVYSNNMHTSASLKLVYQNALTWPKKFAPKVETHFTLRRTIRVECNFVSSFFIRKSISISSILARPCVHPNNKNTIFDHLIEILLLKIRLIFSMKSSSKLFILWNNYIHFQYCLKCIFSNTNHSNNMGLTFIRASFQFRYNAFLCVNLVWIFQMRSVALENSTWLD